MGRPLFAVRGSINPRQGGYADLVNTLAEILLIVLLAVPLIIVGVLFVWAARKDGDEDRAVQRRLGRRRSTRLGR